MTEIKFSLVQEIRVYYISIDNEMNYGISQIF